MGMLGAYQFYTHFPGDIHTFYAILPDERAALRAGVFYTGFEVLDELLAFPRRLPGESYGQRTC